MNRQDAKDAKKKTKADGKIGSNFGSGKAYFIARFAKIPQLIQKIRQILQNQNRF